MGADLIIYHFCVGKDEDLKELKKNMIAAAEKTTKEEACEWEYERSGEVVDPEEISEDQFKETKDLVIETIEAVFSEIEGMPRDMTWFEHKDDIIYLTGGLSWGDIPTETGEDFKKFVFLPERILEAGKIHW